MFYAPETPVSPPVTSTHGSLSLFRFDKLRGGEVTAAVFDLPCSTPPFKVSYTVSRSLFLSKFTSHPFGTMLKKRLFQRSAGAGGTAAENRTFANAPQADPTRYKCYI